jgi:hypothetical protein
MRLFYKPLALLAGMISARLGQRAFKQLWAQIDEAEPPAPTSGDGSTAKVVAAAALEAATMAAIAAAVSRASARWFHYLTGVWPEKREQDE